MKVTGAGRERFFTAGTHTHSSAAGGRQRIVGGFTEDLVRFNNWTIILAARVDLAFNPRLSLLRSLGVETFQPPLRRIVSFVLPH